MLCIFLKEDGRKVALFSRYLIRSEYYDGNLSRYEQANKIKILKPLEDITVLGYYPYNEDFYEITIDFEKSEFLIPADAKNQFLQDFWS
jgi:hypothetical protein